MLTLLAATVISVALVYFVTRAYKSDPTQLTNPRVPVPTMGVQIICGDCSGDQDRPVRTLLNQNGDCDHCGGHSYVLASSLALNILQARAAHLETASATAPGRILPFEPRAARIA